MGKSAGKPLIDLNHIAYISTETTDISAIFGFCKDLIDCYEDISTIDYEKVLHWIKDKITKNISMYQCVAVDGIKVGYFCFDTTGSEAELDDLYILPEYRGMGVGTCIIKHCIQRSAKPIFLYVFSKNVGAIRLYSRMGFKIAETVGNTRLIMRRRG